MEWRLFATLAETAGSDTVEVEPGSDPTVGDALEALLENVPELEDQLYDADGERYDHVRLLHEGRNPFVEGAGLDEPVEADDELALMPAVSGG